MMPLVRNHHDRLFGHVFSQPEHAEGELKLLLPAEVSAKIDWSTLRVEKTHIIDAKLAERRTDVLFSARLDGRELYLYLLLEHQSSPDHWMALRLLGALLRIWEDYLATHPGAKKLPAIVPMVVSHAEGGWSSPVTLRDLVDLDEKTFGELAAQLPNFSFLLDDLTGAQSEQLHGRSMTALGRLTLFCLKRARTSEDFLAELARWRDSLDQVLAAQNGVAALGAVLRYVLEASDAQPEDLQQLTKSLGPKAEEAFMTGAEILTAEARAEGEAKGKAEVLLRLLQLKFGAVPEPAAARVRSASLTDVDRWVERVITATTLESVLAD